jgi:hypothetical protein
MFDETGGISTESKHGHGLTLLPCWDSLMFGFQSNSDDGFGL